MVLLRALENCPETYISLSLMLGIVRPETRLFHKGR